MTTDKKIRIVVLKANKDLAYMRELFEAGKVIPVIDGPYRLSQVPEAFRHFGEGRHKGKVVITLEQPDVAVARPGAVADSPPVSSLGG
jgi:NADPH:quinone reductase-like Zn-dependent oxidoreductase